MVNFRNGISDYFLQVYLLFDNYQIWIENEKDIKDNMNSSRSILVKDRYANFVFLFENEFATRWFEDKFPEIKLERPIRLKPNHS